MTSKLDLSALRQFAEAIDEDSSILFLPELSFLRKSLSKYGDLKPIPERDDNLDGEEENDDDIPDLDESPELNAGFTSSFVPETKYENEPEDVDPELISPDPMPYLPIPTGGEDYEKAAAAKDAANDAKANSDYALAVEMLTEALTFGPVTALTLANRAECLLKLRKPCAAISDCDAALGLNPDSAKAFRCRGKANRYLGNWVEALSDLSNAQRIDFDEGVEEVFAVVKSHVAAIEAARTKRRLQETDRQKAEMKRRQEQAKSARQAAEEKSKSSCSHDQDHDRDHGHGHHHHDTPLPGNGKGGAGGPSRMPGGMPGFPAGMPGGGADLMSVLMSDPELAAGFSNPKIMRAMQTMGSGGPSPEVMNDPEVRSFMTKIQAKLGGMGRGGGGGGRFGEGPGSMASVGEDDDDDDDLPDLDDVPNNIVEELD